MPVTYLHDDILECPNCLHTWDYDSSNSGEHEIVTINCPQCNEPNQYETDEVDIPYGDDYL